MKVSLARLTLAAACFPSLVCSLPPLNLVVGRMTVGADGIQSEESISVDIDPNLGDAMVAGVVAQISESHHDWFSGGLTHLQVADSVCDRLVFLATTEYNECTQFDPAKSHTFESQIAQCADNIDSLIPTFSASSCINQPPCLCNAASVMHDLLQTLFSSLAYRFTNLQAKHGEKAASYLSPDSDPLESAFLTSLSDFTFSGYEGREDYKSFMDMLTRNALSLEAEIEGSMYVYHGKGRTQDRFEELKKRECILTKLHALAAGSLSSGLNIGEVGFNAGHSAYMYLDVLDGGGRGTSTYHGFDICRWNYTRPAADLLRARFGPSRVSLTCGDSLVSLREYKTREPAPAPFDVFVVDGYHDYEHALSDIVSGCAITRKGGASLVDDCNLPFIRKAFLKATQMGIIEISHAGLCWADMCHGTCL